MSTDAEIVTYAGRRYRVAGRSTVGTLPEPQPGTVCRGVHSGRVAKWPDGWGGEWRVKEIEILAPLDASPPAETPRCEAPGLKAGDPIEVLINGAWRPATFVRWVEEGTGCEYTRANGLETGAVVLRCVRAAAPGRSGCEAPGWCGKEYRDLAVPAEWHGPHDMPFRLGRVDSTSDPAYCTQACADRARAAAAPKPAMGPPAVHMSCGKPHMPSESCPSIIPAGYRLAKGWRVLDKPGFGDGRANMRCWWMDDVCCRGIAAAVFAAPNSKASCLDCAERRGAIERVEDRQGLEALAGEVREKLREIGARPSAPCLSHHPELGSRCEAPPGPHDMHIGRRPGTAERCEWWDALAPAETRAERWRRTHPGYGHKPEHDMQTQIMMVTRGLTTFRHGVATMAAATNHKPAPWSPSDPEADIPWVWQR